jgi:hypothetical protein
MKNEIVNFVGSTEEAAKIDQPLILKMQSNHYKKR